MSDIIDIGIKADSTDVKKAREELVKLADSSDKTAASVDKLGNATSRTRDKFGRFIKKENEASQASDALASGTRKASKATDNLGKHAHGASGGLLAMASSTARAGIVMAALAATAALVIYSISKTIEFNKSISELSAITGATGKNLEFLRQKSIELGSASTKSSVEVATAFKLVASAKPDLLDNAQALAQVTEEVIKLSEAAGIGLAESADTVGGALNQFSASSDQAARFVNVLAAGAKFGSSAINQTAEALKIAGTSASMAGLSFEETNAAIQAMAKVSLRGSEAGTGLRGVLLKLSTQTNKQFNPETAGFTQSMLKLEAAHLTTTQKVKLFGLESFTAANAIIKEASHLKDLTDKLTGTNTATEQAATITNNLDGDLRSLGSSVEALGISFGSRLAPVLRTMTQLLTDGIDNFRLFYDVMAGAKTVDTVTMKMADIGEEIAKLNDKIATETARGKDSWKSFWGKMRGEAEADALSKLDNLKKAYASLNDERSLLLDPSGGLPKGGDSSAFTDALAAGATKAEAAIISLAQAQADAAGAADDKRSTADAFSSATKIQAKLDEDAALKAISEQKAIDDKIAAKELRTKEAADAQAAIDRKLSVQSDYFARLKIMAEDAGLSREDLAISEFDRELTRIEEKRQFLEDNSLLDAEAQAAVDQAKLDAETYHVEKINAIRGQAIAADTASAKAASKLKMAVTKGEYGSALNMTLGFMKSSGALNKKQFQQVKMLETGIVIAKGIGTVSNAINHGSEKGGVWGAALEGGIAAAMVAAQVAQINSASMGGSAPSAPRGGGSSSSASRPPQGGGGSTPAAQNAQQQQQVTAMTVNITPQFLDMSQVTPDTLQTMADSFAPALADSMQRGQHLTIGAA